MNLGFLQNKVMPPCEHFQRVSQLISETSFRKYIDNHLFCSFYSKKIQKIDCLECPKYKPTQRTNANT